MTTEAIHIAGEHEDRPVKIPVGHAAKWLLGNKTGTDGYNRVSVRLYDFADTDDLACKTTESDRVTFADLGRMTCLAASLRYDRAHLLMELSQEIDWPEQLPRLEDLPSSERADDFIVHDGVARGHALFRAFKDHTGLGSGTVSKLLHLKWPAFYPITDSQFLKAYGRRAARVHSACRYLEGSPSKDGNIRAYWFAFRCDLARNNEALGALPEEVAQRARGDVDAEAHADRLRQLEPLRLLDMLAWKVGREM